MQLRHGLLLLVLLAGSATIGLSGCEEQGPAEEAGEQIDESAEETGESLDDAQDEMEEEAEE